MEKIVGGTNWGQVGGACVNGIIGNGYGSWNWKSAVRSCLTDAFKNFGNQQMKHRKHRKHR